MNKQRVEINKGSKVGGRVGGGLGRGGGCGSSVLPFTPYQKKKYIYMEFIYRIKKRRRYCIYASSNSDEVLNFFQASLRNCRRKGASLR